MAYKTLVFGTDDIYDKLKPLYDAQVQCGNLEIVAYASLENDEIHCVDTDGNLKTGAVECDIVIVSSEYDLYRRMRLLESMGVPLNRIIDGKVFRMPHLDFRRLVEESVAYGVFDSKINTINGYSIHHSVYEVKNTSIVIKLGRQTLLTGCTFEGDGKIFVGDFSSLAWNMLIELGLNKTHNFNNVSQYDMGRFGALITPDFYPPWALNPCRIEIGNDVWIGRGCILKCTNPNKPLVIGDGAIVASDSVVVKSVPPYAIVGGNPAQIIKYRFPPHVVESLLRIKWWDWSIDKIYENFKYFNDVEKFISLHDK
ncbi:MAG: CatB-related O-acetyltransferase [Selenomonadaceae bacterium]|nr:CatB-related O-acetyltransferase [Selenomonadaceae bacterium]